MLFLEGGKQMVGLKQNARIVLSLVFFVTWSGPALFSQTLKEKLDQKTTFIPRAVAPVEQLIEIAQNFKIPMAIEWLEVRDSPTKPSLDFRARTVGQLIQGIIDQTAGRRTKIEGGVLHVFSLAELSKPLNFLNVRIPSFEVKDKSLLDAEALLRTKINMLLYPERYRQGFGGGYGAAPEDPFWVKNITFSGAGLTIREILTHIARANGNALWVVTLSPTELIGNKPKWEGVPPNKGGHSPLNNRWKFVPLNRN
jgi:hypothetical protein